MVNSQWIRNSFDATMGAIGGFAGFLWGMLMIVIGGYQDFDKQKSFTQSVYSYQEKETNFDKLEEEEMLDEYFLAENLQGRNTLQVSYLDIFLNSWLCCFNCCLKRFKCWNKREKRIKVFE